MKTHFTNVCKRYIQIKLRKEQEPVINIDFKELIVVNFTFKDIAFRVFLT